MQPVVCLFNFNKYAVCYVDLCVYFESLRKSLHKLTTGLSFNCSLNCFITSLSWAVTFSSIRPSSCRTCSRLADWRHFPTTWSAHLWGSLPSYKHKAQLLILILDYHCMVYIVAIFYNSLCHDSVDKLCTFELLMVYNAPDWPQI